MPDYQNYTKTDKGSHWLLEADVYDSSTRQKTKDKKGANGFKVPNDLKNLPQDVLDDILDYIAMRVLNL